NVAEQRHARRVQIDADVVDARLDHAVERLLQVSRVHVMLIQADTDVLWIDLHKLAERVLQPTADRDGAAQRGIVIRKFLPSNGTGGVDTGAGFVDDDV